MKMFFHRILTHAMWQRRSGFADRAVTSALGGVAATSHVRRRQYHKLGDEPGSSSAPFSSRYSFAGPFNSYH